jgi:hypothetical protein
MQEGRLNKINDVYGPFDSIVDEVIAPEYDMDCDESEDCEDDVENHE